MARILLAALFASVLFGVNAHATSLVVDTNGILIGAKGVLVGGALYDVQFVEGTCASVFGVCDQAHFDFTTENTALAASRALLDSVLLDGPGVGEAFDTNPALTYGCIFPANCWIATPYAIADGSILVAQTFNDIDNSSDHYIAKGAGFFTLSYDSNDDINGNFAKWTAVPEASTITFMLIGVGALSIVSLRRRTLAKLLGPT